MSRELEKILKEKWFLVAADFIAVAAILLLDLNMRDGFDAFLAVMGIMGASLIVVVPVILEGGNQKNRLAEQARLRAALKEEVDALRLQWREADEQYAHRFKEIEQIARSASEAVAQRASVEVNSLKAANLALETKVKNLEKALGAFEGGVKKENLDEVSEKIDALAQTVRGAVADGEEANDDLKKIRAELKKVHQRLEHYDEALATLREASRASTTAETASTPSPLRPADEPEEESDHLTSASTESDEEIAEEEDLVDEDEVEVVSEESPVSNDGSGTSLIINLMIGIGNKPFVRGTGPGLSSSKGVPMIFLGIGRWQWTSPDPDAPVTIEIWKNDQTLIGEPIHISGGESMEIQESHFSGS
jgi:hypothetical protein